MLCIYLKRFASKSGLYVLNKIYYNMSIIILFYNFSSPSSAVPNSINLVAKLIGKSNEI